MRELHEGEQGLQASNLSLGLELQAVDQRLVLALLPVLARIPPVNGLSAEILTFKKPDISSPDLQKIGGEIHQSLLCTTVYLLTEFFNWKVTN